jgi:hypothetical protein
MVGKPASVTPGGLDDDGAGKYQDDTKTRECPAACETAGSGSLFLRQGINPGQRPPVARTDLGMTMQGVRCGDRRDQQFLC